MGRTPNYRRDRARMRAWSEQERRVRNNENVIVQPGRGKYPDCLQSLPYGWCPDKQDVPSDPTQVPKTCKFCQEFLKSKFYDKHFADQARKEKLERLKAAGLPTRIVSNRRDRD